MKDRLWHIHSQVLRTLPEGIEIAVPGNATPVIIPDAVLPSGMKEFINQNPSTEACQVILRVQVEMDIPLTETSMLKFHGPWEIIKQHVTGQRWATDAVTSGVTSDYGVKALDSSTWN